MGQHSQQILYTTMPSKCAMSSEPLGGDLQ